MISSKRQKHWTSRKFAPERDTNTCLQLFACRLHDGRAKQVECTQLVFDAILIPKPPSRPLRKIANFWELVEAGEVVLAIVEGR